MENNVTLSNYESMIFSVLKFKTAYELFDENMTEAVALICEDAVSQGNSWISGRFAPDLRELLFRSRFGVYKTLGEMFDYYVSRYNRLCAAMEETPHLFTTDFREFTDFALVDSGVPDSLKSMRDIVEYCEQAESLVGNGYQNLEEAYRKYRSTYEDLGDRLVEEDLYRSDEWNQEFEKAFDDLEEPVDILVHLLRETADHFRNA